ncbi:hypothetical protein BDA96_01G378600 [Sorghum bicolor]|uniref:Uncharacterized protein n=2 Tax=Sorghum bicolor TaxID=4558 RepID=A0A1Z5S999_SORBI|nr:hypothetical protein BDA96_01G378600 [Sorghum bicolor]KAG0550915.1 hypothetical protein BDA96_01G378600 [Sorghum bicolor]OQU92512.1 hypothetical protein SORBI_3001G354501 [Sorghum bicolor]OQU92513.1 hypothetical protein SORBI_3001G354501 [Sorghum bicolor]OQU92514.1 hypothetical protein SORBI_3001G354501 [Sorghum bicolor]
MEAERCLQVHAITTGDEAASLHVRLGDANASHLCCTAIALAHLRGGESSSWHPAGRKSCSRHAGHRHLAQSCTLHMQMPNRQKHSRGVVSYEEGEQGAWSCLY